MYQRLLHNEILEKMKSWKICLITGARQVGKTTLLKMLQKIKENEGIPTYYITLENSEMLSLLDEHPENIFKILPKKSQKILVFIDEIQYLKDPSNFLKLLYDEHRENLQIIATGSSSFYLDKKFHDSLAGRKWLFELYPLSLEEFFLFKNKHDFVDCLEAKEVPLLFKNEFQSLLDEYLRFGGYPEVVLLNEEEDKKQLLSQYIVDYVKKDMLEGNITYHEKYSNLLKLMASNIGQMVNYHELANTLDISVSTIQNYLYVMQKSYHVAWIRPFTTNKRKELTKMPKVYLYDLGLRNALLNNFSPLVLRNDGGQILENFCFSRLLKRYGKDGVSYRRTQAQQEVDFIVEGKKAFECKVSLKQGNLKKYKVFTENYPEIPLQFVDFDEAWKL